MKLFGSTRRRVATVAVSALLVAVPVAAALGASASDAAHGTVDTAGAPLIVRTKPTSDSAAVGRRCDGARVSITCQAYGQRVSGTYGTSTIWDRLGSGGYVSDAYVRTGSDGPVAPLCGNAKPPTAPSARVRAVIAAAKGMTGRYPYSWGGGNRYGPTRGICCSPSGIDDSHTVGFDCSGLMEYAFHKGAGIAVSSTSRSQYADGPRVPLTRLRAGDLVFWSDTSRSAARIHHVALYIGNGTIVEADRVSGPDVRVRSFSTAERGVMPYVMRPVR